MNVPARIMAPASPDYSRDGYGWSQAQTRLLKARAFDQVDWENVIEEIECMGNRERSEYESHLTRILAHMIKWEVQPERRSMSWWLSIMNGRDEAERVLSKSPSLKPSLPEIYAEALRYARRQAERETGNDKTRIDAVEVSYEDAVSKPVPRPTGED